MLRSTCVVPSIILSVSDVGRRQRFHGILQLGHEPAFKPLVHPTVTVCALFVFEKILVQQFVIIFGSVGTQMAD